MPITQQRVADLIALTRAIIATYEGGEAALRAALEGYDEGSASTAETIDQFRSLAVRQSAALAPLMIELEREEGRVAATRRRNERERGWRRERREEEEAKGREPLLPGLDDNQALRASVLTSAEEDAIGRAIAEINRKTGD